MKKHVLFSLASIVTFYLIGQPSQTQTLKGQVIDSQSKFQLIGATILLWNPIQETPLYFDNQMEGSITDANGEFRIENLPIGRYTIKVSYVGYQDRFIDNVLLLVGKETVINTSLEESVLLTDEIVITAEKTESLNEMAVVSSRQFTVEETGRYAGSRNDPARMAANYAGVSGSNDARNDIIIRGNSPTGVLWKMDGLPIGNPNHFGSLGTTGGPVSMLNNNVLSNSDFLTGAFPAEYGNANAGVFDLQMRKGNSDKREYLGQIGFNGFEVGAEGPFSSKSDASYLINYRYSTLGFFQKLGTDFGTGVAVPEYQDMSYKINLPTKKIGTFSAFAVLGKSAIELLDSETDTTQSSGTDLYGQGGYDSYSDFSGHNIGFNHHFFFNKDALIRTGVVLAGSKNIFSLDSLGYQVVGIDTINRIDPTNLTQVFEGSNQENRTVVSLLYNNKLHARNTIQLGGYLHFIGFNYLERLWQQNSGWVDTRDFNDTRLLVETYSQWLHRFSDRFSINTGIHYQYFALNGSQNLEPRLGLKYQLLNNQSFNIGYGLHGQVMPLAVFIVQTEVLPGVYQKTNKDLTMTKSHHFVMGYEKQLGRYWRIKAESYYQHLFDVPVTQAPSAFSMLNYGADFGYPDTDSLVNNGLGRNYGLEITVEKFLSDGYYVLFTGSLFNSLYTGSDGVERSTAFNNQYVVNLLCGKEWKLKTNLSLVSDIKMTLSGGRPYSPIDLVKSRLKGGTIRFEDQSYSLRYADYFRADAKVYIRLQGKKTTQEWGLEIQNITNRQNLYTEQYSRTTDSIEKVYQIGFFPVPQYRILF